MKTDDIIQIFKDINMDEMGIYKEVAILVPLIQKNGEIHILYEVRADSMKTQPGEICFPGGKVEKNESTKDAAIRETSEELGIEKNSVIKIEKIGRFHTYHSLDMHCYIGEIKEKILKKALPNEDEVKEIFTVPLSFFLKNKPEIYNLEVEPKIREDFVVNKLGYTDGYNWRKGFWEVPIYRYNDYIIWGLTAKITKKLIEILETKEVKNEK